MATANLVARIRRLPLIRVALGAVGLFLLFSFTTRVIAFAHLFGTHAGVALTQPEVLQAYEDYDASKGERKAYVPKIIHQIFHNWTDPSNEVLPADWVATRQTCIDYNEDWEHRLWTAEKSRNFLQENYPTFVPIYDNYKFPVQRIDALRYHLLRHYGGIYLDLDNGCKRSLEPLLYYPTWTTDGGQGALSNNILGSEPNHPYWILMTDSLTPYAWKYPLPYVTIMYASGQWFQTKMWELYHRTKPASAPPLTRVMMDFREGAAEWTFFFQARGGTWNNWDNVLLAWIGQHLALTIIIGVVFGALVICAAVMLYRVVRKMVVQRQRGYSKVPEYESIALETNLEDDDV